MTVLLIIGLLCFCFAIGYVSIHLLQKIKIDKGPFQKALFYPFLVIGLIFSIMSVPFVVSDSPKAQADPSTQQLLKDQKQFTTEISRLKTENDSLSSSLEEVTTEKETLTKQLDLLTSQKETVKQHEQTIQELEEKINQLTSSNESLKKKAKQIKKETQSTSPPKDGDSRTGGHESQKETKKESAACNIKGSLGGIYHTPSSRYYSRIKHVAKMFCSVKEAERAGYRAPKQ
ncbi:hypothetical protein QUF51_13380 [Bacillus pumilus]|nr:hypothetical protein [Bacillus pumilus]